jgi:very-short-patch-repair endonuclease
MANQNARNLRKRMTRQEIKLWMRLRELRRLGFHFRRQSPILEYIVDFECRKAMLVIEVDGGQHNLEPAIEADRIRDDTLRNAGYRVLRFWNHDIDQNLDGVLTVIRDALNEG